MIVAEVAITLMMVHITAEVAARLLMHYSLDAVPEIVAFYYMAGLTFLSLAFVTRANGHIAAEVFTDLLSHRTREIIEAVIGIGLFLFMALFAWQTFNEAVTMTRISEVHQAATLLLPKWPPRWFLPGGAALMAVMALLIAVRKLIGEPAAAALQPAARD